MNKVKHKINQALGDEIKCHCCESGTYGLMTKLLEKDRNMAQSWYVNEKVMYIHSLNEINDVFLCLNPVCKHVYRNYYGDAAEYHATDYRKEDYDKTTDHSLHLGPIEEQTKRINKVHNQLHLMKYFVSKNDSTLEIASGKGYFLRAAKEYFVSLKGSDIDPKVISHNAKYNSEIEVILSDVIKLPEDKKYDVVVAMDVLEHVEDTKEFVQKMYSLTNKYAVVQVPVNRRLKCPNDPKLQDGKEFDGHLHYFSEFSLNNLFTRNNMFKCVFMYKSFPNELANGCEILAIFEKT